VSAATGPSGILEVTATSAGHRSRARITSTDGKPLTLTNVRYTCALPPKPSFCPAQRASGGAHSFRLSFMATRRSGIVLSATVGPVAGHIAPVAAKGGLPTSAYTPTELVVVRRPSAGTGTASTSVGAATTSASLTTTPGATSATLPSSRVTASPGSRVAMVTRLKGLSGGLPQRTTVTIDRGPAESLTVAAAVPEAHTSRATIGRTGGGKLSLTAPVFVCTVPPAATVCPPQQAVSRANRYSVTFMASPHSPQIVLQATVQSG
jgi:hypothetical protein